MSKSRVDTFESSSLLDVREGRGRALRVLLPALSLALNAYLLSRWSERVAIDRSYVDGVRNAMKSQSGCWKCCGVDVRRRVYASSRHWTSVLATAKQGYETRSASLAERNAVEAEARERLRLSLATDHATMLCTRAGCMLSYASWMAILYQRQRLIHAPCAMCVDEMDSFERHVSIWICAPRVQLLHRAAFIRHWIV